MLEQISSKTKSSGVMLSAPSERQSLPENSGFASLLASSLESSDKSPVSASVGLFDKKSLVELDAGNVQLSESSEALFLSASLEERAGKMAFEGSQSEQGELSILAEVQETGILASTPSNLSESAMTPLEALSRAESSEHVIDERIGKPIQVKSLNDVSTAFQAMKSIPEQSVGGGVLAQERGSVKAEGTVNNAAVVKDEIEPDRVLNMVSLSVRQDVEKLDKVPADGELESMSITDSYKMLSPEKQSVTDMTEHVGLENIDPLDSEEPEVKSGFTGTAELEAEFDGTEPHQLMSDQPTVLEKEVESLVPTLASSEETEHLERLDSLGLNVSPVVEQAAKVTATDVQAAKTQDIKFDGPSSRTVNSSEPGLSASMGQKGGAMDLSQQGQQGQGQQGAGQQSQGQAAQQQFMQMAQSVSQNVQALRQQNMERQAPLILNSESNLSQSQLAAESELLNSATGTTDKRPQLPQGLQTIGLPVNHQRWGQALGQRVVYMANNQLQQAQITLNPEKLGPVQIKLHIDKEQQVHVVMNAQHGVTREAMESAMPRLKEMMEQAGIDLGSVDVSDQQNASDEQEDEQASVAIANVSTEDDMGVADETAETVVYSADNIVDYYA